MYGSAGNRYGNPVFSDSIQVLRQMENLYATPAADASPDIAELILAERAPQFFWWIRLLLGP
jgi:hypothetical protein